jgi:hypothetical protein
MNRSGGHRYNLRAIDAILPSALSHCRERSEKEAGAVGASDAAARTGDVEHPVSKLELGHFFNKRYWQRKGHPAPLSDGRVRAPLSRAVNMNCPLIKPTEVNFVSSRWLPCVAVTGGGFLAASAHPSQAKSNGGRP